MHKVFLAALVAAWVLSPIGAHAEGELPGGAEQSAARQTENLGWNLDKLADIGAGAVIGGVAAYYGLGFTGASVVGVVVGGAIGSWWYEHEETVSLDDIAPLERKKAP
jgi:hypothetical protein